MWIGMVQETENCPRVLRIRNLFFLFNNCNTVSCKNYKSWCQWPVTVTSEIYNYLSSYSYIWRFWGNRIIKNNNVCIRISIKQTSSTNYANGKQLEQSQDDRKWKIPLFSVLRYVKQMFSFWGFWNFCFQFVSFGCFLFRGVLIINTLQFRSRFSRRR